jgi:predicted PurR-regulated permease PerM
MNDSKFQVIDLIIRIAFVSLIGFWCFILLRPFIAIILWGTIIAVACYPIFQWLKNRIGGRANLAATLIALIFIAIILGPVGLMAKTLAENVNQLAENIGAGTLVVPSPPQNLDDLPLIGEPLNNIWQLASVNLKEALKIFEPQLQKLGTSLLGIVAGLSLGMLQFLVSIVIAAGLMLNARFLHQNLIRFASRITPTQGPAFLDLASSTLRNVIRGIIGVSALQTFLIGIAMIVAGIPSAGLLILICLVLTIIQIGPGLIVIGTIIFAWAKLNTLVALIYTIWMIPAMLIDNVLKPILMARGLPVPMLVIFIGVFGGTIAHGIIGLFIGPVVLAFGYELLKAWTNNNIITAKISQES